MTENANPKPLLHK